MKIEIGRYYERRDGVIAKAIADKSCSNCDIKIADGWYRSDCWGHLSGKERDIIREVTVTDGPPCELVAGREYETEKPDGTAGPVVKLRETSFSGKARTISLPFYCDPIEEAVAMPTGECMNLWTGKILFRIVRPFVKPKTPIERLKAWRQMPSPEWALLDSIIADLER